MQWGAATTQPHAGRPAQVAITLDSVEGPFTLLLDLDGGILLHRCGFGSMVDAGSAQRRLSAAALRGELATLANEVRRAIAGEAIDFADLRLAGELASQSPFFAACRRAAQRIPAGATVTYGELAALAGSPAASRAAGQAMRRNPYPIVVPCHRVVAASGAIGGYAGAWSQGWGEEGGLTGLKARLLAREAAMAAGTSAARASAQPALFAE